MHALVLMHVSPPVSSLAPGVFYTYFYNHAHRLRLEKLLYLELSRSPNGFFKALQFYFLNRRTAVSEVKRPARNRFGSEMVKFTEPLFTECSCTVPLYIMSTELIGVNKFYARGSRAPRRMHGYTHRNGCRMQGGGWVDQGTYRCTRCL